MSRPRMPPRREIEDMSDMLAQNARLDNPLPAETDYTAEEEREVQVQLHALTRLPPYAIELIYLGFSARHLAALVRTLSALNPATQPKAHATLLRILARLPEPKTNAYARRLLRSPRAAGLPSLVARAVAADAARGVHLCTLLINLLFWCDVEMGDDRRASVDKDVRAALSEALRVLQGSEAYARLEEMQRVEVERLLGVLGAVENMPTGPMPVGYYLISTREHLEGSIPGQEECDVCMEDAGLLCSMCKSVRYCGQACQTKAWKDGHKYRCFVMAE